MSRLGFLVREALVNLRRNLLVVSGAVLAVFMSLLLAFGSIGFIEVVRVNTIAWQKGVHIIAWMKDPDQGGLSTDGQLAFLAEVKGWPEVKDAYYVDKGQAWQEFQQLFASRPELIQSVNPSALPASIRIELKDISTYRDVQYRLTVNPAVRQVSSFGQQMDQISSLVRGLSLAALGLALVLGLSAVVLIANTIRMAIYARRDEVAIMKLVGAGNWFVRIPFLLEGLMEGVIGSGLAVLLVWIVKQSLPATLGVFTLSISTRFFALWGARIVLFGAAAGVLGSLMGLSRYLKEADGAVVPGGQLEPTAG